MSEEINEKIEELVQEGPSRIEELEQELSEYEINDIRKAVAIGKIIVLSAYEELKVDGLDAMIDPALCSNIIKDVYQTREVTRRELIRMKNKDDRTQPTSQPERDNAANVMEAIKVKGYAYPDKLAKQLGMNEDALIRQLSELVNQRKLYLSPKGYYGIPKR